MNKLHLCCNQTDSRWEVLDEFNNIVLTGTLKECESSIKEQSIMYKTTLTSLEGEFTLCEGSYIQCYQCLLRNQNIVIYDNNQNYKLFIEKK